MSARTRRSLTLLWTALFVLSLGLQYMTFAAPPSALAVHDEDLFELDGNAVNDPAVLGDDWNQVYGNSSTADATTFVTDPTDQKLDQIFTGGGSKDDLNVNGGPGTGWKWTIGSVPDKDNITNAYAAAYKTATDTIVYFGLDRLANNGDAFVGFWFFKNGVGPIAAGDFSGQHTVGDLLVLSNFTNGGTTATIELYEWVGSGGDTNNTLNKVATGNVCTGAPATDKACAVTNLTEVVSPWPYTPKFGTDGKFPVQSFFEGGINLTELYDGDPPCFSGFLGETRSSSSVDAVLKDFAFGNFNTCEPPEISTTASASTINVGESVTDTADFTTNTPAVTGSVDFFVCGPTASATACTSGGTKVGATKAIAGGTATSDPFPVTDPTKTGYYCFRAEYTPDQAGSLHYTAGSHTNATTECFQVIPAQVTILKTTSTGTVSAGDPISFTLSWGNSGAGQAKGVVVSDNLPTSNGLSWSISGSTGTGSTCQVAANVLTCNVGTIPGNTAVSGTVTLTSNTTSANCGVISNTGHIASTNDGAADSTAGVTVQCPALTIVKTADAASVNAGDPIGFTITVSNSSAAGTGTAKAVTLADPLPAGVTWTESPDNPACSIAAGVLSCSFGDLAPGASVSVHVSATTSAEACTVYDNTATASASNHPDVSASAVIECQPPDITVEKTADVTPIDAGDSASFTIEVWNAGPGIAYGATLTDTLPAGTWVVDNIDPNGVTGPVTCDPIVGGVLSCDLGTMEPGRGANSVFITIARQTSVAECTAGDYSLLNSVVVAATNEPAAAPLPNEDSATIDVLCPELGISKESDNEGPVSAGDQVGFTVTIVNSGTGSATGVSVDDPLPAGLDWTLVAADTDAGWTLSGPVGSQVLSFAGSLAAGQTSSAHVVATSDATDCGSIPNLASLYQDEVFVDDDDAAEVVLCAAIDLTKTADDAAVIAGDQIGFTLTVTNTGEGAAKDVHVADPLPSDPGLAWTIAVPVDGWSIVGGELVYDAATLAGGASSSVHVVSPTTRATCGAVDNTGTVTTSNDGTDSASASVTVICPALTLEKSNDAPIETIDLGDGITVDLPTLEEGDSATFTLVYTLVDGPVDNGVLTDVLPEGMAYVDGTASSNDEFSFVGYDAATRTLRWEAETVTESGTLTYEAQAQEGASDLAQPLVNVATIDSDQTDPDSDDSDVFVPIVEAVTSSPSITPPPTDTFAPATQAPSNPGFALMLVLLGLAGFALTLGFITPVPERIRRRDRRS